jgi:hypothetical protein
MLATLNRFHSRGAFVTEIDPIPDGDSNAHLNDGEDDLPPQPSSALAKLSRLGVWMCAPRSLSNAAGLC